MIISHSAVLKNVFVNYPIIPNFSTFLWHASIVYFPNLLKKEKKFIIHFSPKRNFCEISDAKFQICPIVVGLTHKLKHLLKEKMAQI